MKAKPPVCLTIAGLDPSGGAGIIADIKTFTRFDCFATAVITSLTFQNTTGVFGAVHQTAEAIRCQAEPILSDLEIAAVKTGMLPTNDIIGEVADLMSDLGLNNLVVDPVVRSTSGYDLIDEIALRSLVEKLFPLSLLITPNLPEAERITGLVIKTEDEIERAARMMRSMGAKNVLVKGGHLPVSGVARDLLFSEDGVQQFEADYVETTSTHGTGCTLSAAITANLALGKNLSDTMMAAKKFVTEAIKTAPGLGAGNSPINI